MYIDRDIGFDPRDVLTLLALQSDDSPFDVIGGCYTKKQAGKGFADNDLRNCPLFEAIRSMLNLKEGRKEMLTPRSKNAMLSLVIKHSSEKELLLIIKRLESELKKRQERKARKER